MAKKLTFKELKEKHGLTIDPAWGVTRIERTLTLMYEHGQEDASTSQGAREAYLEHVSGKPVTPVEQTLNIIHKSPEESAAAILELIQQKKREQSIQ